MKSHPVCSAVALSSHGSQLSVQQVSGLVDALKHTHTLMRTCSGFGIWTQVMKHRFEANNSTSILQLLTSFASTLHLLSPCEVLPTLSCIDRYDMPLWLFPNFS